MYSTRVFAPLVQQDAIVDINKDHPGDLYETMCQHVHELVEGILNAQDLEQLYNSMKELCSCIVSCPLPSLEFHQELAMYIRDLVANPQTDPKILRLTLLLVANMYSINGSPEVQDSLFDISIIKTIQNLFDRDLTIWKHILLVIAKVAALSEYGRNVVIMEFGFRHLTHLINCLYPNDTDDAPYRGLLASISRYQMDQESLAQWVMSLSDMAPFIGSLVICPLSRIGRWISISAIAEELAPLCEHVLSIPSPKDEICAAMMILSYANMPINELICDFAKSDDDAISASAVWYIGRHIAKYPNDVEAIFASGIIERELYHLANSTITRREESVCFFCRIIEVTNALLPQELLELVAQGISDIVSCTSDLSIILRGIRTMTMLVDKDIINSEFIDSIEEFCNHENDEIVDAVRLYLDASGM